MIRSADEFRRLRNSESPEEYRRAAYEEAPLSVWLEVIATSPELREWVAHNKTVPMEVLEVLGRDESSKVRWVVAQKRKLSTHLQLRLAEDPDAAVRTRIAFNEKAIRRALELLVDHPDQEVREHVGMRLQSGAFEAE